MDHIFDERDECYHTTLSPEDRRKKWFTPGNIINTLYTLLKYYSLLYNTQAAKHMKNYMTYSAVRRCCQTSRNYHHSIK